MLRKKGMWKENGRDSGKEKKEKTKKRGVVHNPTAMWKKGDMVFHKRLKRKRRCDIIGV